MTQLVWQSIVAFVIVLIPGSHIGNGGHTQNKCLDAGGAAVMHQGFARLQPGDYITFINHLYPAAICRDFMINVHIFDWMGPHNYCVVRERALDGRDHLLEVIENCLLEIMQPFGKFPAHAHGATGILFFNTGCFLGEEQIQAGDKCVDVAKVGVYKNEIAMLFA